MILVTGGTGLVGSHLLYSLLQKGRSVRAIHRKNSDLLQVKEVFSYYTEAFEALFQQIEWVEADITDIPQLTEAFKGITHVYHAAAYISFDAAHFEKLRKTNIEGTANVVNLCLAFEVQKLCYVSSVATLGNALAQHLADEATEWNAEEKNSVYAITKYGAEMEAWRGTQEGLNAVIVNPGIIIGEGFWNNGFNAVIKMMAKEKLSFYTSGGMGLVDVKDVVAIMQQLMESTLHNERFVLVATNVTYRQLLTDLANYLSKKPPEKYLKKWKIKVVATIDWLGHVLTGRKRKLLPATVQSMYTTSFYDASKIKETLQYQFTPYQETLERITNAYGSSSV